VSETCLMASLIECPLRPGGVVRMMDEPASAAILPHAACVRLPGEWAPSAKIQPFRIERAENHRA
jgi:hypothetical protein